MNVFIYVVDALRADHLSCYGYHRKTSPNIDSLAEDGVLFERCYSPSTWTKPVAASLLSGTYPTVHGVKLRNDIFSSNVPRLPMILRREGFRTACVSAIGNVSTTFGYAQGFDFFCDLYKESSLLQSRTQTTGEIEGLPLDADEKLVLPLAEDVNTFFLPWFKENIESNCFGLLWSLQPHSPYSPPEGFRKFVSSEYDGRLEKHRDTARHIRNERDRRHLIDLYDSEIYYNDHCFGELLDALKDEGQYDESLIVVLADHGQAFGEHGIYAHGHLPYEEVVRAPLIVKFPNSEYANSRVPTLVSLIDLFPSILDFLGMSLEAEENRMVAGKSFMGLVKKEGVEHHSYVYSETKYEAKPTFYSAISQSWKYIKVIPPKVDSRNVIFALRRLFREKILRTMFTNPLWLIRRYGRLPARLLFNLDDDPAEANNLASVHLDLVEEYELRIEQWLTESQELSQQHVSGYVSAEQEELMRRHLEDLGYL
jgi:arylsulfatase